MASDDSARASAYVRAVEQYYERIYAFLYRMTRDAAQAEDLTQDTFAAAWRSLDSFEGRASFGTWLHKIALNVYRDYRRRAHAPMESVDEEEDLASPDLAPELIERLAAEELRQRAEDAVGMLPEIYREAVVLRCYQGLKYREVAELIGVPVGTVQHRIHVAFEKLRVALREEVVDCETLTIAKP